jgi:hypothetical protein
MNTVTAHVDNLNVAALNQLCINTICTISIDAVRRANSEHLGTPLKRYR